jgi:hypothetical protein
MANRASVALGIWLVENDRSQEWLAKQIRALGVKVHQTRISALLRGDTQPRINLAVALESVTSIGVSWWGQPASDAAPLGAAAMGDCDHASSMSRP